MQLKVSYEDRSDAVTVVRVESDCPGGTVDVNCAWELRKVMVQLAEQGRRTLIADLSGMDDINSVALDVLVGGLKRAHFKGARLSVVVTSERLRNSLPKAGPTWSYRIHDTVAGAEEGDVVRAGRHTYEHLSESITLVKVMLDLDVYTSVGLRKVLVDLIKQGRYFLVIDLTEVEYLDSTGLGVIVGALKYVRAFEGALALVVPYEPAVKQFRITGLTKVFPIFRSVDPAVEFLGREVLGAHARR